MALPPQGAHFAGRPRLSLYASARRRGFTTAPGSPRADVAFSFDLLRRRATRSSSSAARHAGVEAADDDTVTCASSTSAPRDVPLFVAGLPIFSRAYYTAHNFDERPSTFRSAPAPTVGRFEAGRYIEYQRVADWWGAELPVNVGQNNFDSCAMNLPRPRRRLRGLHGEELSVPRGVHLAHLGDALRFSGHPRRPGQARGIPGRYALGRPGLVLQSRRAKFANPRLREALELCLRFRMDQQGHHVRRLSAHPVGVSELRHDGERSAAGPEGTQAA